MEPLLTLMIDREREESVDIFPLPSGATHWRFSRSKMLKDGSKRPVNLDGMIANAIVAGKLHYPCTKVDIAGREVVGYPKKRFQLASQRPKRPSVPHIGATPQAETRRNQIHTYDFPILISPSYTSFWSSCMPSLSDSLGSATIGARSSMENRVFLKAQPVSTLPCDCGYDHKPPSCLVSFSSRFRFCSKSRQPLFQDLRTI